MFAVSPQPVLLTQAELQITRVRFMDGGERSEKCVCGPGCRLSDVLVKKKKKEQRGKQGAINKWKQKDEKRGKGEGGGGITVESEKYVIRQ